jgi:hypothetical protein
MIRGFQWDLARQVERLDWLLAQLPRYAEWGYNELYLHLEDAVEYPSLPEVARKDAYSYRQFERLVNAADQVGIKVVPIVNLLGHTQYLVKVPGLRDLNELRNPDGSAQTQGQICPLHPRIFEIAEKLLRDMAPFCTTGKVHVGLDESFHLGKHPMTRREIKRIGLPAHFARYVQGLHKLTQSLDLNMGMWGDMLYFLPEAVPLLPQDVTIYEWYYYGFKRRPRVELYNFAESGLGENLRDRGFKVWGCPMNGSARYEPLPHFKDRLENILSWWHHGKRIGTEGMLVTSWEPFRLALELTTVVDAAAATLWLNPGITDPQEMLTRGFARVFGAKSARKSAKVALACDRYPFGGYPLWQSNTRWDTVSRRTLRSAHETEERYFAQLTKQAEQLPAPLKSSVQLRHYFAARALFIHVAAKQAGKKYPLKAGTNLRKASASFAKALIVGQAAAKEMWQFTRDRRITGANERIINGDRQRFSKWQQGNKSVFGPLCQLCYQVHNFEPCLQLVLVEQQQPDGTWLALQSCHTIEFQTRAAQPHGSVLREHAAPVIWDGDMSAPPRIRIALRGLGRVKIQKIELRYADRTLCKNPRSIILGKVAPKQGLPELKWDTNIDHWPIQITAKFRPAPATKSPNKKAAGIYPAALLN